jgi:hypothetical protein
LTGSGGVAPRLGEAGRAQSIDDMIVDADNVKANAEALGRALALRRSELGRIAEDEERTRRGQALELIERYTVLLSEPVPTSRQPNPARYSFKLVFPDGRWSVDEKRLPIAPREGDVVAIDGFGDWRIQGSERVGARPAGKPPREFFVCAPAV